MDKQEYDLTDLCTDVSAAILDPGQDSTDPKYTPEQVREVLKTAFEQIAVALSDEGFGQRVELHRVGVFALDRRAARAGVLPNGDAWATPERFEIVFRAAPALCADVAAGVDMPVC